uniref:Fibronectin type-III domain-containing protein n=1 Tax=Amphimedon queenslandica TaxID=400682 RepID=A0A1X7TGS7_AMPQE
MLRALVLLAGFLLLRVEGQQPNNLPSNGIQLYLPYEDRIIPDYSMIYASQFYDKDENNDAEDINDALWCQSANNVTNIGVWYHPNGIEVPLFDGDFTDPSAPSPLFSKRFNGQIALARRHGLSGYEGLYKCIIPDENGVDQTLVVGAYTDTGYNNNDGPDADPTMQFSLLSTSRLATPPVFSLSFNVSDGPPTTVRCSVNGNGISTELSRVISISNSFFIAPTGPVGDIIFSSVESVSMTVSWDEVPCNGRNGPITGYYLTYTNITSNTSYTVNITGGDNRMYNLTGLIPYTNYTVSIIPYNYNMNGPARQEIQLTAESKPSIVTNLTLANRHQSTVKVSWNPPTILNGIITVYEIRYRESTSTGPYNITNTTNTYYSIVGLIPNTSYTIGVRAYTSIGPGEWAAETINIAKVGNFTLKYLNATSIQMNWLPIPWASYYTVYYSSGCDDDSMNVSNETNQSVVSGLYSCLIYSFEMSVTIEINGTYYEGPRTVPTVSRSTDTMTTVLTTVLSTVSTTVLVKNGGTITGWIIGVTVLASLLAISVIIILVLVVYIKRANINQKSSLQLHRKLDNDIVMECSPAYRSTTKLNVEPVYDTTGPETTTPPAEYEIPTVS